MLAMFLGTIACGGVLTDKDAAAGSGDGGGAPWQCGSLDAAPLVTTCDDATKAACTAWAQSLVQHGTAHSTCIVDDGPYSSYGHQCAPAIGCYLVVQGDWACNCGNIGGDCQPGQVCVTDDAYPGGHCVAACSH